jgi:glycosyltransferase involved in cell wall biosynthesis
VPTLNEASGIVDTLWALEPLRKRGVEIIVVDGNSKDATAKLAASHADLVVNSCPGRASQMNAGAMHASAQTLLFLHADTVLPDNADTVVLNALNDAPGWGRFDVNITGTHPMLKVIALLINIRSRPGYFHQSQLIFTNWRFSKPASNGGHRNLQTVASTATT